MEVGVYFLIRLLCRAALLAAGIVLMADPAFGFYHVCPPGFQQAKILTNKVA